MGFEPREAHVTTAATTVTRGAGGTRPPHLVWRLANPVAPGRKKVPGRWGQRAEESSMNNLHTGFQISAPPQTGCTPLGKSHLQASVSSSVRPRGFPPVGRRNEDEIMQPRVHAPSTMPGEQATPQSVLILLFFLPPLTPTQADLSSEPIPRFCHLPTGDRINHI